MLNVQCATCNTQRNDSYTFKTLFMSKKIQLHIPTPCHENWDNMNPVDKGRFCMSCQKKVIDFTGMNDEQLIAYLKKPAASTGARR